MGIHIGLIGSGMVGKVHLDALVEHPAVSAISLAEADPARAADMQKLFRLKSVYSDYRQLLDADGIDVVDICLPHDLHFPAVVQALQAGKHVILEKPISNTLAEADEMIAAAETAKKRLYVCLNERFMPVHQQVKQVLQDNLIGQVVMANLTIAGSELDRMNIPEHWKGTYGRAGGGALADSGTHVVDLALDWFGFPAAVQCSVGRFVVQPVNKAEDTASLVLKYPDKLVNIQVTYAAAGQPWSERRSVWGKDGSIEVYVDSPTPIQLWQKGHRVPVNVVHNPETWWQDSVKAALKHALDGFANEEPFCVTPQNAREALMVIRSAYASAEKGQTLLLSGYPN